MAATKEQVFEQVRDVLVDALGVDEEEVNGKSIMGILMLGAEKGSIIVIEIALFIFEQVLFVALRILAFSNCDFFSTNWLKKKKFKLFHWVEWVRSART